MMREPSSADQAASGERPTRRDLKPLRSLWVFVAPYRWAFVGAVGAIALAAASVLGLGSGLRMMIDRGFVSGDGGLLDRAVLILFGVVLAMAVASYGRYYLVSWVGERVVADIRRAVFDHVVRLDPGFYDRSRTGEILSRLTTDIAIVQVVVGSSVGVALRNLLLLGGGLILLLITSPKLTGLTLLAIPAALIPILTYGRKVRRLSRLSQDQLAEVGVRVDESLAGIRTVQAFGQEARESARFAAETEGAFDSAVARIRARSWLTAVVIALVFGAVSLVLYVGGHDVLAGRMSPGDLASFVFFAALTAGSAGAISEVHGDLQRAAGAAERLAELLATPAAIAAPAIPAAVPIPARGAVRFDAVRFCYPTRPERSALDGLSFSVAPGERVALVGPSGAGKSTIFQLLLRFYDPQSGTILFDDAALPTLDPAALRGRIGLVPQDPVIFAASAAENIRYGRPDASAAEVERAAEAAFAADFIARLPQGYATDLGERGVRLSGGQKQRIAIARAILRDPALLLLDEATSALDAESERAVQQALERLMVGRTSIVIAHRLATVASADRILVLDHGQVVAEGKHAELMAQQGLYARLADLQFGALAEIG